MGVRSAITFHQGSCLPGSRNAPQGSLPLIRAALASVSKPVSTPQHAPPTSSLSPGRNLSSVHWRRDVNTVLPQQSLTWKEIIQERWKCHGYHGCETIFLCYAAELWNQLHKYIKGSPTVFQQLSVSDQLSCSQINLVVVRSCSFYQGFLKIQFTNVLHYYLHISTHL